MSAFTAALTFGMGDFFGTLNFLESPFQTIFASATMGLVQGGLSELMYGGGFETGFLGTFAGSALGAIGAEVKNQVYQTVKAAVIGGTVSEIGGGKFANGAAYAAFQYAVSSTAEDRWLDRKFEEASLEFDPETGTFGNNQPVMADNQLWEVNASTIRIRDISDPLVELTDQLMLGTTMLLGSAGLAASRLTFSRALSAYEAQSDLMLVKDLVNEGANSETATASCIRVHREVVVRLVEPGVAKSVTRVTQIAISETNKAVWDNWNQASQ